MAKSHPDLAVVFQKVDDLLVQGQPDNAVKLLSQAIPEHFFSEELHDRCGLCHWALAEQYLSPTGNQNTRIVHVSIVERIYAGRSWFLSGVDDERRRKWRELITEECKDHPDILFRDLRFPELPFDKFTDPSVRQRLNALRVQLTERGFDDAALRKLLWTPNVQARGCLDRIAPIGCALMIIGFFAILWLAWLGLIHLLYPIPRSATQSWFA